MKFYSYDEIKEYKDVNEIIREHIVSFGSIDEGKMIEIIYLGIRADRNRFKVELMNFKNGKQIRLGDKYPSIIILDSKLKKVQECYLNEKGFYSRVNGPAIIDYFEDGTIQAEHYYNDGRKHRDQGLPASIFYSKKGFIYKEVFYDCGKISNIYGPAEVIYNGTEVLSESYYIDGKKKTPEKVNKNIERVKDGSIIKSINRTNNIETINLYEKIAKYYDKKDVLEAIDAKKVILKLQGKI